MKEEHGGRSCEGGLFSAGVEDEGGSSIGERFFYEDRIEVFSMGGTGRKNFLLLVV